MEKVIIPEKNLEEIKDEKIIEEDKTPEEKKLKENQEKILSIIKKVKEKAEKLGKKNPHEGTNPKIPEEKKNPQEEKKDTPPVKEKLTKKTLHQRLKERGININMKHTKKKEMLEMYNKISKINTHELDLTKFAPMGAEILTEANMGLIKFVATFIKSKSPNFDYASIEVALKSNEQLYKKGYNLWLSSPEAPAVLKYISDKPFALILLANFLTVASGFAGNIKGSMNKIGEKIMKSRHKLKKDKNEDLKQYIID